MGVARGLSDCEDGVRRSSRCGHTLNFYQTAKLKMILFGLTIVLCLHGAINANVVDENFQIVYPQQLRKAKVLEDLPLDGSFEDEELSAIITEPLDQKVDVLKKETTLDVVDDDDKKSK